jgi:trimethylamine:corrinoid methyltransferase-like protein
MILWLFFCFRDKELDVLMEFAKRNQIVVIAPMVMSGISGPVNLMGSAVQQNVEIIAGLALDKFTYLSNQVSNFFINSTNSPKIVKIKELKCR